MYPINAAAVVIEERMHMTGEPYSVLCDSEEMIVAVFVRIMFSCHVHSFFNDDRGCIDRVHHSQSL